MAKKVQVKTVKIGKRRIWGFPWLVREDWAHGTKIRVFGRTFRFWRREIESRFAETEKRLIQESGWWDPLWYVKTYHHDMSRSEALDHWYRRGWREGEDPGPRFSVAQCPLDKCGDENPLVAYLNHRIMFFTASGNVYRRPDDEARVRAYRAQQGARKAKGVVYTCVTGGYDDIREIAAPGYIAEDWDYVCFTDDAALAQEGSVGVWQMRPLAFSELDLTRNNRWHKMHPHVLFPEYEASIYIDANINVLSRKLFDTVAAADRPFVLPRHFENQCVYAEFRDVFATGKDDAATVERQLKMIRESGMPPNYGLGENNVLYRRHHEKPIVDTDEAWWQMVRDHSKRDQLSLVWLFWKNGWKLEDMTFENTRLQPRDFLVFSHVGAGK